MFFYPTPSHRLNLIIIVKDLILYLYQHQLLIRSISTQTQKKINKGPRRNKTIFLNIYYFSILSAT